MNATLDAAYRFLHADHDLEALHPGHVWRPAACPRGGAVPSRGPQRFRAAARRPNGLAFSLAGGVGGCGAGCVG